MKFAIMMALAATANAQMEEEQRLFRYFGNCQRAEYGSTELCDSLGHAGAQCCNWVVQDEPTITGKFCVTPQQRNGIWEGEYRDSDFTLWNWQCKQPAKIPGGGDDKKDGKGQSNEEIELPPWSTYPDKDMELWLWITYWSGAVWVLGWVVMLPVGLGIYTWLALLATWNFFEIFTGVGTFEQWFMGPFWRSVVGPIIFTTSFINSIIPGWGILTAWLTGWWANLDYYGYDNYTIDTYPGILPPKSATAAEL